MHTFNFKIKIRFFPLSNGKTMAAQLKNHSLVPDDSNIAELTVPVTLPCSLNLVVSGKDMNHDTILDANGKVLEDLHIRILEISLDGFKPSKFFVDQNISLVTEDGQIITSSYIGFNGKITIDLPHKTVFQQVMSWTA